MEWIVVLVTGTLAALVVGGLAADAAWGSLTDEGERRATWSQAGWALAAFSVAATFGYALALGVNG
jgi:hypothetical protein